MIGTILWKSQDNRNNIPRVIAKVILFQWYIVLRFSIKSISMSDERGGEMSSKVPSVPMQGHLEG